MKKVKFTLGLMLSLLFVGANVVNAALVDYRPSALHYGDFREVYSVQSNEFYDFFWSYDNHTLYGDYKGGPYYEKIIPVTTLQKKDTTYFNDINHFGYILDPQARYQEYNKNFSIGLKYKDGNELMPILKVSGIIGKWFYDDELGMNVMEPTGGTFTYYIQPYNVQIKPFHDRKSGTARYDYNINMTEYYRAHPIYSINYEVTIHDEIGTIGSEAYDPPGSTLPIVMRKLKFDVADGISTSVASIKIDNTVYVPSYKNFTFKVYSAKEIEVSNTMYNDEEVGEDKQDYYDRRIFITPIADEADAYSVTIKQINANMEFSITQKVETQGATGEDGQTGTDAFAEDGVWGANGTLYVKSANAATLSIYNIAGQICKQTTVSGNTTIPLAKGLYIVQLNGKAYKVVL